MRHLSDYMPQVIKIKSVYCIYAIIRLKGRVSKKPLEIFHDTHSCIFMFLILFQASLRKQHFVFNCTPSYLKKQYLFIFISILILLKDVEKYLINCRDY